MEGAPPPCYSQGFLLLLAIRVGVEKAIYSQKVIHSPRG